MRKVSLVSLLAVLCVVGVCGCNFTSRFQNYKGYDLNDTCESGERNTTYVVNYPNATSRITQSTKSRVKNVPLNIFKLWRNFPLNLFKNSSSTSSKCRTEFDKYYAAFLRNELNALKMFDATAKLPSGILNGNINQYGDFDQCMEVPTAQYCLAEIDIDSMWTKSLSKYKELVHSHFSIKDTFDDPGHRIPGFSLVKWGFCIPNSCSSDDLTSVLKEKLKVPARVRFGLCQPSLKVKDELTFGDYFARVYFGIIILAVCVSTYLNNRMDSFRIENVWFKILMSFSLKYNCRKLIKPCETKIEFKSVHGVRCLSALALLMAHKTMALLYNPYINRTWMTETQAMKWSVLGRNAIIYTDCFLLISGLLNANAIFADLNEKEHKIKFKRKLQNRLFRILPSLITVILFCTYILPYVGSGPLWPLVINHHAGLCKKYMWRNILMIHNYYGFENMCLTHTHQLGIDMQLFLVTPIFVYFIWKLKIKGLVIVILTALSSTGLRYWKTMEHNLSHIVHFGIPISRMFDTANYSYILPTHRATIYLIGIMLAYFLRNDSIFKPFSKKKLVLIWTAVYVIGLTTWFGPVTMSVRGYKYNRFLAAMYGAFSPITWGVTVAWIIYASERGIGSWFTTVLTWKYFQLFTKVAYGVYLVQFPVFFYNVGITRHVGEFKSYMMLPPIETGIILLISTILTVCVEMPFQNVYKIFISSKIVFYLPWL